MRKFHNSNSLFKTLCMENDRSPAQLQASLLVPNLTNLIGPTEWSGWNVV